MKTLIAVALILLASVGARAAEYAYKLGPTFSTATGTTQQWIAGQFYMSPSSMTISTPTIMLDGASGSITGSSATLEYGISSATGNFSGSVTAASMTIQGSAFSVGGSTLIVTSGDVGIGGTPFPSLYPTGTLYAYGDVIGGSGIFSGLAVNGDELYSSGLGWVGVGNNVRVGNAFFEVGNLGSNLGSYFGGPIITDSTMTVQGNAFSVGGSTFVVSAGAISLGSNVTLALSGASGNVTAASSVTASSFWGDGSHLTGVNGGISGLSQYNVPVAGSPTTLLQSHIWDQNSPVISTTMTVIGNAFSVGGSTFIVAASSVGINLSNATPAAQLDVNGSAQFGYGVARSTFDRTGDLTMAKNASLTISGPTGYINTASSVTASAFFGDGSHLSGISVSSILSSTFTASYMAANQSTSCTGATVACFSGSTQTLTAVGGGSGYEIDYSGAVNTNCNSSTLPDMAFGVLLDGQPMAGSQYTAGYPRYENVVHATYDPNGNNRQQPAFFIYPNYSTPLSAGTHTICLLGCATNGCSVYLGNFTLFGIKELR